MKLLEVFTCRKRPALLSSMIMGVLLSSSQPLLAQSSGDSEGDILDFMSAIIAATNNTSSPKPPETPVNGMGNFRIVKVNVISRSQPQSTVSENAISWSSAGVMSGERLALFNLSGGNSLTPEVITTTNFVYDAQLRLIRIEGVERNVESGNQTNFVQTYAYTLNQLTSTNVVTANNSGQAIRTIASDFIYSGGGLVASVEVHTSQGSNLVLSATHSLSYDGADRVISNRTVKTFAPPINQVRNSADDYTYNSAGNLIRTVSVQDNLRTVKTYEPRVGNKQVTRVVVTDTDSGVVLGLSDIETLFEAGLCRIVKPTDSQAFEGAIRSNPYSPDRVCIRL